MSPSDLSFLRIGRNALYLILLSSLFFGIFLVEANDGLPGESTKFSFMNRIFGLGERKGSMRKYCRKPTLENFTCSVKLSSDFIMQWRTDEFGVDFAFNLSNNGWFALGFAQTKGLMVPADAVIFTTDVSQTTLLLSPARIFGRSLSQIVFENTFEVNDTFIETDSDSTFVQFRRRFGDGNFPLFSSNVTYLNWAHSASGNLALSYHGSNRGSIAMRLDSNLSPFIIEREYMKQKYQIHAWMMWLVFTILIPMGILFSSLGYSIITPFWALHLHAAVQLLSVILCTASILIVVFFRKSFALKIDFKHRYTGFTILSLIWLQVIFGIIRKKSYSKKHENFWHILHWSLGLLVLSFAWVNIFWGFNLYGSQLGEIKAWRLVVIIQIVIWTLSYIFFTAWKFLISLNQSKKPKFLRSISYDFDVEILPVMVSSWDPEPPKDKKFSHISN